MKKTFVLLTFFALLQHTATAATTPDLEKLKKEMRIFTQVIEAAYDSEDDRGKEDKNLRPHGLESVYLANQGILLMVDVDQHRGFHFNMNFNIPPMPPMAPIAPMVAGDEMDEDAQREMMESLEHSYEEAMEGLEGMEFELGGMNDEFRKQMESLAQEQRQLAKEAQQSQRQAMEQLKNAAKLTEEQRAKLKADAEALKHRMSQKTQDLQERINKLTAEEQKKWEGNFNTFLDEFLGTVCEYGASLKNLPDSEYMTLLFRGADRSSDEPKDKILVLSKADLAACRNGQITASQLRTKAQAYSY